MNRYLCHNCAVMRGVPLPAETEALTGTVYQLDKFIKHTTPPIAGRTISIFSDPSFENYRDYLLSAAASGWVQEDDRGIVNIVYYAGRTTGLTFNNGKFIRPADSVKIVFHDDKYHIHAYPDTAPALVTQRCVICGVTIPYEP